MGDLKFKLRFAGAMEFPLCWVASKPRQEGECSLSGQTSHSVEKDTPAQRARVACPSYITSPGQLLLGTPLMTLALPSF